MLLPKSTGESQQQRHALELLQPVLERAAEFVLVKRRTRQLTRSAQLSRRDGTVPRQRAITVDGYEFEVFRQSVQRDCRVLSLG